MGAAELLLVCALDLLGRSRDTFPLIRILQERPLTVSREAVAFVDRRDRSINLIATALPFRHAVTPVTGLRQCGDRAQVAMVAGVLAHEEWHLLHGPDEAGAYAQQLTTLHALGYGPGSGVYHAARKAMAWVAEQGR